jgi:hypothetical protein
MTADVSAQSFRQAWLLQMRPIWRPEMLVANHQSGLRNSPQERRHYLHTGRFIRLPRWTTIIFPFRLVFLMERRVSSERWAKKILNHAFLCFLGWSIWWSKPVLMPTACTNSLLSPAFFVTTCTLYYVHPLVTNSHQQKYALCDTPFMNCFDTDMPSSGNHYNKGTKSNMPV